MRLIHCTARSSGAASIEESRSSMGGRVHLRWEQATTRAILGGRLRTALDWGLALSCLSSVSPLDRSVRVVVVDALFIHHTNAARADSPVRREGCRNGA